MGEAGKRAAADAALELIEDGMRLGLGSGTTVAHFLEGLAARDLGIVGVPTSEATAARCHELDIPLLEPSDGGDLDLCIDGADEFDDELTLTKGGGGALLREKVVAWSSSRMVVIATPDKQVARLADSFPLPVEVVAFALAPVTRWCEELGLEVAPRDGGRYRTDNGHAILDVRAPGGIDDPGALGAALAGLPGVCEHGLFLGLAKEALLGDDSGEVEHLGPVR